MKSAEGGRVSVEAPSGSGRYPWEGGARRRRTYRSRLVDPWPAMSRGGTCASGLWSLARMYIALLPMSRTGVEVRVYQRRARRRPSGGLGGRRRVERWGVRYISRDARGRGGKTSAHHCEGF